MAKAKKKNAGRHSFRKTKKVLKKHGYGVKSKRGSKGKMPAARRLVDYYSNPKKMKRVTKSSGWIDATAVKFVKKRGQPVQVLVRKPARRKRK